jgi:hypothetical protein
MAQPWAQRTRTDSLGECSPTPLPRLGKPGSQSSWVNFHRRVGTGTLPLPVGRIARARKAAVSRHNLLYCKFSTTYLFHVIHINDGSRLLHRSVTRVQPQGSDGTRWGAQQGKEASVQGIVSIARFIRSDGCANAHRRRSLEL